MNFTPSSVILPRAFAASTLVALGLPLKYSNTSFWVVSKFFWVAISLFWVVLISSNCSFWVAESLFWVVESLFWIVESLFWIVSLSFKASFWIVTSLFWAVSLSFKAPFWIVTSLFWAVSLSFKAPFWIVERSLGVPTEKAKDPPWFAVQMGSVADSVAAKIRIFFNNTNHIGKLFAGYSSLQAYFVPSENTPGNTVATNRSFASSEMKVFSSQRLSIISTPFSMIPFSSSVKT